MKKNQLGKEVMGFLGGSVVKNPAVNAGDGGLFPGLGECPGEGNGNSLQAEKLFLPYIAVFCAQENA